MGLAALQYVLEEGNPKDWFADRRHRPAGRLAAVCLVGMLWWELSPRNQHPVVNFRVLQNRDLAARSSCSWRSASALYGGTFIFPLFTQSILRFTPTETGLALLPGGLATASSALLCGTLLNGPRPQVDARILIGIGVCLLLWAMWDLGHLTRGAAKRTCAGRCYPRRRARLPLHARSTTSAYASLKPSEAQQAAGLINLSRQLGGSFGIALLASFVTTHTQIHRADLVSNVYAGNVLVEQRLQAFAANLLAHGYSPDAARHGALAILDQQVTRQAAMLSYNDAWMLLLLTFLIVSPAILLLRRPKGRAAAVDAH